MSQDIVLQSSNNIWPWTNSYEQVGQGLKPVHSVSQPKLWHAVRMVQKTGSTIQSTKFSFAKIATVATCPFSYYQYECSSRN